MPFLSQLTPSSFILSPLFCFMGRFLGCCWRYIKNEDDNNVKREITTRSEEEVEAELMKSFQAEIRDEEEQNKRAIAVAAAAAAAADAAVAAAQAAVAAVRLTSKRNGSCKEKWAAVKIQSAFRGYLARKALRALKGLVKLQALVKGCLVRKQTASTLRSMQALIRVQATIKSKNPIFLYHRRSLHERDHQMFCKSRRPQTIKIDSCSSSLPFSSPLPPQQIPHHLSTPKCRNVQEISSTTTASSTPRFATSVCGSPHCWPNYMASTRSFEAKVRSQSAPRQRPPESSPVMRRRVSMNEEVDSRASLSGVGKEAAVSFKSAVVGRLDRGLELVSREEARDYHLIKRW